MSPVDLADLAHVTLNMDRQRQRGAISPAEYAGFLNDVEHELSIRDASWDDLVAVIHRLTGKPPARAEQPPLF